ncbi:tRNA (adenosine(37)-N6)-threonylcarbamoyltransferase complex transferase subunit TsaD [Sulfurospirillum arcachonense]|uniref:tRNA (adenosine(37)-N6)-threonylcarbamoyltransferase complex transferase subunit TsaD n=1 Tax=Sulfurospirillum arcachonense TaxID=57666 RepID=UPI0004693AA5|nr:tRNA (adenosine(37)-N6)-threonylcarbamoyltransferase complex transferase subunit TsaD [Sulfurospirillum arcachonense]
MILSIESSCDDSSIAITRIRDAKLLFHKKISQEIDHSQYGGVVPELAARLHAIALPNILEETKKYFKDLKAVAVTNEPGLSVTLVEGVCMAKALSLSLDIPLLPINHLKGHIYSLFIDKPEVQFPLGVLLVSGGHTQVLHVKSYDEIEVLATTLDDSFGESFDKVAKMLGLGYPGGPVVEKSALSGDATKFDFTVPLLRTPKLAFSYSGLKNQVRLAIEENPEAKNDICASFQNVATKHLIHKLKKILQTNSFKNFAIVGGASANKYLRSEIEKLCQTDKMQLLVADMQFCSDNAAMIGRCAIDAYRLKRFAKLDEIDVNPRTNF